MPYASIDDRRAAQRRSFVKRYWQQKGMREKEAARKSAWFSQDHIREHSRIKQQIRRLRSKRDELQQLVKRAEQLLSKSS